MSTNTAPLLKRLSISYTLCILNIEMGYSLHIPVVRIIVLGVKVAVAILVVLVALVALIVLVVLVLVRTGRNNMDIHRRNLWKKLPYWVAKWAILIRARTSSASKGHGSSSKAFDRSWPAHWPCDMGGINWNQPFLTWWYTQVHVFERTA